MNQQDAPNTIALEVVAVTDDTIFAASTTDYDVFTFDPTNRPIDRKHVDELKRLISKRNLLRSYPIIVSSDNGKWVVRDGQHRLTAARELGVPIYYTFNDEMQVQDVIDSNNIPKGWTTGDRLRHYCIRGFPEYIKLQKFLDRYSWMTIPTAVQLCHYGDRATMGFDSGNYLCNDIEFAEQVAHGTVQLARFFSFFRERSFVLAVAKLFEHEGYRHERMLAKLEFQADKAKKCTSVSEYMRMFDGIYNYKSKDGDRMQIRTINANSKFRRADRRYRNSKGGA